MTTTGTTDFNLNFTEIAEEAYERAGKELRSGYDLRTARRSLNLLTIEWANRGLNLWTIEQGSIPLVAGTASYDLPTDTIDLIDHVIRTNAGSVSNQADLSIARISVSTYATIPNKLMQARPIQLYVDRRSGATNPAPTGVVYPRVTVWPVPDQSGYTLVYWRLRRMQDAGSGVESADLPFRFLPCLCAGLAYYVAMKIPEAMDRLQMLKMAYEEQWQLAAGEDRERATVRFVPRMSVG